MEKDGTKSGAWNGRKLRPMPPDFPVLAPTMTRAQLRRHYHCGCAVVARWSDESGADFKGRNGKNRPPEGFREAAASRTQKELVELYGRSSTTIRNWLKATGAKCRLLRAPTPAKRDPMIEIKTCLNCTMGDCRMSSKCSILAKAFREADAAARNGQKTAFDNPAALAL